MGFSIDKNTLIKCDNNDFEGLNIVAGWVREDLNKVFGKPEGEPSGVIIAGTSEKSETIRSLYEKGLINRDGLSDENGNPKWEVYKADLIDVDGIKTIVIQGSDKRGAIYGILSVSELCGVTPLVNWSGARPVKKKNVQVKESFFGTSKEPSVKYRGIFINDEWPAFGTWATTRFGGINAKCYAQIFELLLRLRANYMWPAMWNSNFSMDGPGLESAELADKLGIVMSTSHHEPCMRTGEEFRLLRGPGSVYGDAWDFLSNREGIIRFWEDGLKRNAPFENVITMGMRGERDTAIMGNATLEENIALLKDIIRTQNDLIRKHVNEDLSKVPRQIVLFTEVEKFYYGDENTPGLIDDPEMDGITVVFSDTNYGYTRTLPLERMRGHKGGYGMYYHVDMHGGAYSYEWIGSTYLPRIWDQLGTTYDFGVRNIWVVNVGDLVSQELEVSYIMKMAYDFDSFGSSNPNNTNAFVTEWIKRIFGGYYEPEDLEKIREVIDRYTLINERCKHEIMNEHVYHPVHFDEAMDLYTSSRRVLKLCDELLSRTPADIRTAFYELIYYPAYGTANLHRTWIASQWNKFYADQNRNTANDYNKEIDEGIRADEKLIEDFHSLDGGKFYGQALSEHFGFRFWNDSNNQLPTRLYVYPANKKRMLISKTDEAWYYDGREYTKRDEVISDFLRPDIYEITLEISCGSKIELNYVITKDAPWITLSSSSGRTMGTDRVTISIDRTKIDRDKIARGTVVVSDRDDCFVTFTFLGCRREYYEKICRITDETKIPEGACLICNGYGAVEASHYDSVFDCRHIKESTDKSVAADGGIKGYYEVLKPYGRSHSGIKMYPNTLDLINEAFDRIPYTEYVFVTENESEYEAEFVFAPSIPVDDSNSQCFAYSVNGTEPVRTDTVLDQSRSIFSNRQWSVDNRRNAKIISCDLELKKGINRIRYYQMSPNLILERIVLWDKAVPKKESYIGPKESYRF
ncbi:MAG: glycosyl hydrolase 115 family protein [Lachnospiraceae bacterium]|nr:glycosyl hydrolase 115 family protein [Lachnospiraceae bacterium]